MPPRGALAVADFIGSSGTLVGAALESAGYFYQSYIVDYLIGPFRPISYLIFVLGAILTMSTLALQGRAQFAKWLILGPILYIAILTTRTPTKGSDWIYGGEPRNSKQVEKNVQSMVGRPLYQAEVPALFAVYNRIVSSATRSLVAALNSQREKMDIKMLLRAQLYSYAMTPQLQDPRMREVLHLYLLGDCRQLLTEGREMADERNTPEERCAHAKRYAELADRTYTRISSQQSLDYLSGVLADNPNLFTTCVGGTAQAELSRFQASYGARSGPSCNIPPLQSAPPSCSAGSVPLPQPTTGASPTPKSASEIARNVDPERERRKEEFKQKLASQNFSCHDIWNFVYGGLLHSSALTIGTAMDEGKKRTLKPEEVSEFLQQYTGQEGEEALVRAISRRLFKDETIAGSRAAFIADYERRGNAVSGIGISGESDLAAAERARGKRRQQMYQSTLITHALSLPHYQGLILYFLGISFPFFAMLLLVPGKNTGFHLWFLLWLWAKSWDVGYALVALADDVLFSLFVAKLDAIGDPQSLQLAKDLSLASLSLREVDPTFNLSTYYNILGVLLHSIPFISSYIIVGAISRGASIISAGINRTLQGRFGVGGGLATTAMLTESEYRTDAGRRSQESSPFAPPAQGAAAGAQTVSINLLDPPPALGVDSSPSNTVAMDDVLDATSIDIFPADLSPPEGRLGNRSAPPLLASNNWIGPVIQIRASRSQDKAREEDRSRQKGENEVKALPAPEKIGEPPRLLAKESARKSDDSKPQPKGPGGTSA